MKTPNLLHKMITVILPLARKELSLWESKVRSAPDPEIRQQAVSSIRKKAFHCLGGAVYALRDPENMSETLRAIIALQTISDYLDNLCDRSGVEDMRAFAALHEAMLCAVDLERTPSDFYRFYPWKQDGGYLAALVETCRHYFRFLPGYDRIRACMVRLAGLYCDLQVNKHLSLDLREQRMQEWYAKNCPFPELAWWEFGAASGSTLALFLLMSAARDERLAESAAREIVRAYFPYMTGLHILLDYFIDVEEDACEGDLNFVSCYRSLNEASDRISRFIQRAVASTSALPDPGFHRAVVNGMLGVYLSDPKAQKAPIREHAAGLLKTAGRDAILMYGVCRVLRTLGCL
ncbi:MAG: tetraprenyl-beta-curcumene synthase family protein [Bacillota bacterium]